MISRRKFVSASGKAALGALVPVTDIYGHNLDVFQAIHTKMSSKKEAIIGHGEYRYRINWNWGALNSRRYPVKDAHEMVIDSRGRIFLLTNHTQNNVIVYNKDGDLLNSWGTEYPGAHGLTLHNENGEEFLYISDNERHEVIKTTLDGRVIQNFPAPMESGKYQRPEQYIPTETAVAPNGDLYVADGYGEQFILHYSPKGELLHVFGGRGEGPENFDNAHGICIDTRPRAGTRKTEPNSAPTLLITARQQNKLKRFSLEGKLLETIDLPGAYICRPVISGDCVYLATIWSGDGSSGSGFVSILNRENQLVSAPGGSEPVYSNGQLQPMFQALQVFTHPHDVCVDEDENMYVAQWNANGVYPYKLERV